MSEEQKNSPPSVTAEAIAAAAAKRVRRKRAMLTMFLCVLIFASGGVVGWGVSRFLPGGRPGFPMPPDPPVDQVVARLKAELFLTDAETAQVKKIYEDRFAALKKIRENFTPQLNGEYEQLQIDIKKVLPADKFAAWDERFKRTRERMLPRPPPPPGMGPGPNGDRPPGPLYGPPGGPGMGPGGGPPPPLGPDGRRGPPRGPPPPGPMQ